jgi:aldose 1-epimerase
MNFSVSTKKDDVFPVVILKDELQKTEAVIYTFGALLNSFVIDGKQNIVDGFASCNDAKENITNGFKSCKLSPFVCRVNNGEYEFQNKKYKTGKFFLGEEAIHGLLYDVLYDIVDSGADNNTAFVKLQYVYSNKDEGFPFEFLCEITYELKEQNKLSITTVISNKGNTEMPLCDGWHPYFKFGQSINDLLFTINAEKVLEFDDKLLPTGKVFHFDKFQQPEKLSDTFFDNCFVLRNTIQSACIVEDIKNKLKLEILPGENYPYLQVYTPPHRSSIAIENLSSAPDAFNNKIGLIILTPSESKIFKTTFRAEYY